MNITILGSGTSTGIPMVGCRCTVCNSDDPRDRRTRASILVEQNGSYLLVDTSTDLRNQALQAHVPRIDAVLLTHHHADHVNGIDDLRGFHFHHKQIIPCFGSPDTLEVVTSRFSYIFKGREVDGYAPLLEAHPVSEPFEMFGLTVVPVPLQHGAITCTGYRFGDMAYLSDCSGVPPASVPLLRGLKLLIIDALRYTPHPYHLNIEGALRVVDQLQPARTILTHLTHEVSHRDEDRLPQGVTFAFDGQSFELQDSV